MGISVGGEVFSCTTNANVSVSISNFGAITGEGGIADCYSTGTVILGEVEEVSEVLTEGDIYNSFYIGEYASDTTLQVGISGDSNSSISFRTNFLYTLKPLSTGAQSSNAYNTINTFLNQLSDYSTKLGATQNRLESALESNLVKLDNLTSSLSTARDADMSKVSSEFIKQQILQQAAATLMSTANQSPSIALQLL